ncbi:MAG: hypothetical protein AAGA58_04825 [Verrucomicrobiota bacterium]
MIVTKRSLTLSIGFITMTGPLSMAKASEAEFGQKVVQAAGEIASPMLNETMKHVELGGPFFGYLEVDGDLAEGAEFLQKLFVVSDGYGVDFPEELNIPELLLATGLPQLRSIGASSVRKGNRYSNRVFIENGGKREGWFKMMGGAPAKPLVESLGLAGMDMVYERDLDLSALGEFFEQAGGLIGGEAPEKVEEMLADPMPSGLSFREFLQRTKGRMLFMVDIYSEAEPSEFIPVPLGPENVGKIPPFDALLVADGMAWFFGEILGSIPPEMAQQVEGEEGSRVLSLPSMGPGVMERMEPVLIEDVANDRLILSTSSEFWKKCLAQEAPLSGDGEYVAAFEGLPEESNGLFYFSSDAKEEISKFIKEAMDVEGQEEVVLVVVDWFLKLLVGDGGPEAGVQVNLDQGILIATNSDDSLKKSAMVVPMGLIGLGVIGFAAEAPQVLELEPVE